jgi:hypothetical protein
LHPCQPFLKQPDTAKQPTDIQPAYGVEQGALTIQLGSRISIPERIYVQKLWLNDNGAAGVNKPVITVFPNFEKRWLHPAEVMAQTLLGMVCSGEGKNKLQHYAYVGAPIQSKCLDVKPWSRRQLPSVATPF